MTIDDSDRGRAGAGMCRITKHEAARRQLVTAIRLLFEGADSISVYSLAHAAWEVLDALCAHRGAIRFRDQVASANGKSEVEIKKIASYGRNFFKHADTDPDKVLEDFSDELNDHVLIAATFDYGTLAACKPMEVQVFQLWYFAVHPEKADLPEFAHIREGAAKLFPGITALDRPRQTHAGLLALVNALRDEELMRHPSTDRSKTGALT